MTGHIPEYVGRLKNAVKEDPLLTGLYASTLIPAAALGGGSYLIATADNGSEFDVSIFALFGGLASAAVIGYSISSLRSLKKQKKIRNDRKKTRYK